MMKEILTNNFQGRNLKSLLKFLVPVAVLIAVIIYSILILWPAYKQPAKYTYTKLDNYNLISSAKGQGVSFSKPVQLTEQTKAENQVELTHLIKKRSGSHIAALSIADEKSLSQEEVLILGANLTDAESIYNVSVVKPIKQFAADRIPTDWAVNLSVPKSFSNKNIKQGAWTMDLTATAPAKNKSLLRGKVIFAVSGNRYYYFMVLAPDYNWQTNIKIWDAVLQSLKIDQ